MRTNHGIRNDVRYNIRNFFQEAKERLHTPDFNELGAPLVTEWKMDPDIHPNFYETTWDSVHINVKTIGSFQMKFPSETMGILERTGSFSSYYLRIDVDKENVHEDIINWFERQKEMDAACSALQDGAAEALTETTIEKALVRMPELKRFLPQ